MSREEAIKELTDLLPEEFLSEYTEAIKMGIEALKQQPTDAVDRVTIKEYLYSLGMGIKVTIADDVLGKIRSEIDEQYDRVHPYDISCAEGLEMALGIIDKYIAEGSEKE